MRKEWVTSTSTVSLAAPIKNRSKEAVPSPINTTISHCTVISSGHFPDCGVFSWSVPLLPGRCFQVEILWSNKHRPLCGEERGPSSTESIKSWRWVCGFFCGRGHSCCGLLWEGNYASEITLYILFHITSVCWYISPGMMSGMSSKSHKEFLKNWMERSVCIVVSLCTHSMRFFCLRFYDIWKGYCWFS